MTDNTLSNPQDAMGARVRAAPRTELWGIINNSPRIIEIAFGQLKSDFIPAGHIGDTGVITVAEALPPGGSTVRDPLNDTGGRPITARYINYSILINGKVLDHIETALPNTYFPNATIVVSPTSRSDGTEDYRVVVIAEQRELPK